MSAGVVTVAAVLAAVPPALVGTASGVVNTFRQTGGVFGVALAGLFAGARGMTGGMHITVLIAAAGAALGAISVYAALRPGNRRRSAPGTSGRAGPPPRAVPVPPSRRGCWSGSGPPPVTAGAFSRPLAFPGDSMS